ncbi:T9SS type A sorting domain-containing protein, partial [Peijinzhouia sedimentorum]
RIPLHILAPNFKYTLSLPDFDIEEGRTLKLYDRFTEEYITLQKGTTYDFEVTDDPRTKGHRFDIVMGIEVITSIHLSNRRFQAYLLPNPAQEQVRISIQKPDNVAETTVKIVSMAGVEVRSEKLTIETTELDINLSQLSKGIYLVEITHGTERIVKRLIVN